MAPTWAISLEVVQGLLIFFSSSTATATALSMPRLMSIGFMPAATYFMPSATIDCASTVAVVVPSPATSEVFEATSFTSCAPMFSNLSLSSISFATDTPSLVTVGAPNERSSTTLRPFGPSVTLTASARMFTPAIMRTRALSLNLTSLAAMFVPLEFCSGRLSVHDGHDVFFAHHEQLVAVDLDGGARVLAEEDLVADLDVDGGDLAVVVLLAGPTASTSPWSGFSAAVSGMTMPEAVLRSSSRRLTITRSCSGRSFIASLLLVLGWTPPESGSPRSKCACGVLALTASEC
jgi:hypothetical protein